MPRQCWRSLIFTAIEVKQLAEIAEQLFPDTLGLLAGTHGIHAQAFEHHHELIPAKTRHGVILAHPGLQALGNLLQEQIAQGMPPAVIQLLEVVQIDKQQRPQLAAALAGGQRLAKAVEQQAAVRQPGQHVVERQPVDSSMAALRRVMSLNAWQRSG